MSLECFDLFAWKKMQLENTHDENKAYAEVTVGKDEVAITASPSGTAHALINIDRERTTFFLGCQDNVIDYNASSTDFNIWKNIWFSFWLGLSISNIIWAHKQERKWGDLYIYSQLIQCTSLWSHRPFFWYTLRNAHCFIAMLTGK